MPRNIDRKMIACVCILSVAAPFAALCSPASPSLSARLLAAVAWLGLIALPAALCLNLLRAAARQRRQAQRQEAEQQRLLALLEATPDLVVLNDMRGSHCYFNRASREMLGIRQETGGEEEQVYYTSSVEASQIADDLFPIGLEKGFWQGEKTLHLPDGRSVPISQVVIAHKGQDGRVAYLSTIARDITQLKQMEAQMRQNLDLIREQKAALEQHQAELEQQQQELQQSNLRLADAYHNLEQANCALEALATSDGLTGLKNHRAFQQKLVEEFGRSARYDTPLSVLLLDVDRFKQFNDTFGHPAGDEVLKQVAQILQATARQTDFVARYGGEEFVLILPETDEQGALEVGERVRAAIERADWSLRPITVSVGAVSRTRRSQNSAQLVEDADKALYISKEFGRNCVTHHDALLNALVSAGS